MKLNHIINKLCLLIAVCFIAGFFSSCEDDDIGTIDRFELSVDDVPDTVFFGREIPLKFIIANAENVQITVTKEGVPGEFLYNETVDAEAGKMVYSQNIPVPSDGSWQGFYVIDVIAHSGGSTSSETKTLYIKEGPRELFLVGGSSEAGWEPTKALQLNRHEKDGIAYHDIFTYLTSEGDGFKILPTQIDWTGGIGQIEGELSNEEEASNFTVEEDGFYRVRLTEDTTAPLGYIDLEIVKSDWGIIGSATPGGWDNDTDMTSPEGKGDYTWSITVELLDGEIKFRENDDWAVNVGGTESELTFDGDNIAVSAGNYTILLNLDPDGYTYSLEAN